MPSEHQVHQILAQMIEDYDNGNANEDLQGFLAGWASRLIPAGEPADELEVLVTGDPFDGLRIEGPYPAGFLSNCDIYDKDTWWVVDLDEPTIKEGN